MQALLYRRIILLIRSTALRIQAVARGSWISPAASVSIQETGRVEIGKGVHVAKGSVLSVLPGAVLTLGDGCMISHGVTIYCASKIDIGEQCRVSHYCSIVDHDYDVHSTPDGESRFSRKISSPITIGANVWVGAHTTILRGASVGANSVVGANSLVAKPLPGNILAYCRSNAQISQSKL